MFAWLVDDTSTVALLVPAAHRGFTRVAGLARRGRE